MTVSWFAPGFDDAADAVDRFERFVAEGPSNRVRLRSSVAAAGGNPSDLGSLVGQVIANWSSVGEMEPPAWFGETDVEGGLSPVGACLFDGLIHEMAHRMIRETGSQWVLFESNRPMDANHLQPVLDGIRLLPQNLARSEINRVRDGKNTPAEVDQRFVDIIARAGIELGPEPEWQVYVERASRHVDDVSVSFPEEAEVLVGGSEAFEAMWNVIVRLDWVRSIEMHDYPAHAMAKISIPCERAAAELTEIFGQRIRPG